MPVSRSNRVKGRDRTIKRSRAALRRALKRQQALAAASEPSLLGWVAERLGIS